MRPFHELSAGEYARLDIGAVNLAMAEGLRGSEHLNVAQCVATLDRWARRVAEKTERLWPRFKNSPGEFENSAAYFRVLVMVTVLQRDLGVGYAMDSLQEDFDATDSRLLFLHGIFEGRGGTCATLPVLYAAVGRRLGYPIRLVETWEHLFCRWEEADERFNIEATTEGLVVHPDEHYLTWPRAAPAGLVEKGWLLQTLSPQDELASFYHNRANCFFDWLDFPSAYEAAQLAVKLCRGGEDSMHGDFLSVVTVLHRFAAGEAQYDLRRCLVLENAVVRPMLDQREWLSVRDARKELERMGRRHAARWEKGLEHLHPLPITAESVCGASQEDAPLRFWQFAQKKVDRPT
ncbi:MAG: transglutaminase-like domain-containing protein [Pirellulales bacterium]|nr:transglutaminase-like domain-containing protein [Pirellulales bacterium]